ncbi:hypothetical protein LVJ85_06505 [Neisseria sp. Dent CA1/247]|uniref:hypothetical protein n=1 Tax=Neisseria sp. Dent CA1/247 TaxID=2912675 RepID=UPI001FD16638|nr:hypothetical protein [Neisseria sp. Dent CA1/247]UOO78103.1 hypothetical protein LVJ85_06505 [Neisseria sp. Dent CA1/247]
MYYQVGNKCLEQSQAENVYFSLVVPQINQNGEILKPEYDGNTWKLNGLILKASLPECNPVDNLKSGLEIGWILFGVMASVYFVGILKKVFS